MQTYRCECGESVAWGSMPPAPCSGCPKCGTRKEWCPKVEGEPGKVYVPKAGNYRQPEPHDWQTRYDEMTGKPYEMCGRCTQRKDEGDGRGEEAPSAAAE